MDPQIELFDADELCGHLVPAESIHRKLADLGDRLFSDADFADMYEARGRHSVPPSLLAKVMLLQTFEGTSDRETLHHVRCDLSWKVALHLPLQDEGFHHTVLTYFRERLRRSERPKRIFERFREVAIEAGLLTKRGTRVLDSTPILSAVQTEDTVSMVRSAMRRLLNLLDAETRQQAEAVLKRNDYDQLGKPAIEWDDEASRISLVDELARDALAVLEVLANLEVGPDIASTAEMLATVTGQDLEWDEPSGRFRIRRGVARDRVISTVDPEARHSRKSSQGHFNGYKAHVAVDPETEFISEIHVAPANVSDGAVAPDLLRNWLTKTRRSPLWVTPPTAPGRPALPLASPGPPLWRRRRRSTTAQAAFRRAISRSTSLPPPPPVQLVLQPHMSVVTPTASASSFRLSPVPSVPYEATAPLQPEAERYTSARTRQSWRKHALFNGPRSSRSNTTVRVPQWSGSFPDWCVEEGVKPGTVVGCASSTGLN